MSRNLRPNCPGAAFHITSRLADGLHPLDETLRPQLHDALAESATRSDVQILAHAIMSNHLHFVVRQRDQPLCTFIQPAMRRVALIVQRHCGVRGHVVGQRYRTTPCLSARHLRDAIVYTHLNPVRAGMCNKPDATQRTSHAYYLGNASPHDPFAQCVIPAWELFSTGHHTHSAQWQQDYREYVEYRQACDLADATSQLRPVPHPDTDGGDEYFAMNFASAISDGRTPIRRMDLRDFVHVRLSREAEEVPMKSLRGSQLGSRRLQKIRERIIRQAGEAGYPCIAVASFFVMSPSRTSTLMRRRS